MVVVMVLELVEVVVVVQAADFTESRLLGLRLLLQLGSVLDHVLLDGGLNLRGLLLLLLVEWGGLGLEVEEVAGGVVELLEG